MFTDYLPTSPKTIMATKLILFMMEKYYRLTD